jgi:hypothetical protein
VNGFIREDRILCQQIRQEFEIFVIQDKITKKRIEKEENLVE